MRVCPECRTGKHQNCDGTAWDNDTDAPGTCTCTTGEHPRNDGAGGDARKARAEDPLPSAEKDAPGALFDLTGSYADVSPCEQYRYTLGRVWDGDRPRMTFVMLNPSTADASKDDATIRKCRGFAVRLGFGGIHVVNLYAYRATKPPAMWAAQASGVDIIGPENDEVLRAAFRSGDACAAWGAHGKPDRVAFVSILARAAGAQLHALSVTKAGAPGHPLMLPYASQLRPWPTSVTSPAVGRNPGDPA